MGYFSGGKFYLVVSLRYRVAEGERNFWCQQFELVSRILHDATDGQHSIGAVFFGYNSQAAAIADIWVHRDLSGGTTSTAARLWSPTTAMELTRDQSINATIIAHELCHYLYDLRDEYDGGGTGGCVGNPLTQACIMEDYLANYLTRWVDPTTGLSYRTWREFFPDFLAGIAILQHGMVSEFCHAGNHDGNEPNDQNHYNNHQSCWTYIANPTSTRNPLTSAYGLIAPGTGGPTLATPAAPPAVACIDLIHVQRFMLVLDRSGSMIGDKLAHLKIGANFWVDYVNAGEQFGLVTYSATPTLESGMSSVPNPTGAIWRAAFHSIVDNLVAGGETAIGDALRLGLNAIVSGGRATNQVMILFTDGLQNAGAETAEQVLPDLSAAGVRCYTIGLGNNQDIPMLRNVADKTGASYFKIDGGLNPDEAAAAISEALIKIAGESRENSGIVSFSDLTGDATPTIYGENLIPFLWTPEGEKPKTDTSLPPLESFKFPVYITEGSAHCTLGALWKHTSRQFHIRVYDPNGNTLKPGPSVREVKSAGYPYEFYEIDNPKKGIWEVEVFGSNIRGAKFRTIGFEVNDRIRFEVWALETHITAGNKIQLRARLLVPAPAPNVKLSGWLRNPDGTWKQFHFDAFYPPERNRDRNLYAASIDTQSSQTGQYLIAIDAYREAGEFVTRFDQLYRHALDLNDEEITNVISAPIRRRSFLSITADREGRSSRESFAGVNTKEPWVPHNQQRLVEEWTAAHPGLIEE